MMRLQRKIITVPSYFFFSPYGAHRDLHSFPTRRSSDLSSVRSLAHRGGLNAPRGFLLDLDALASDRKSTRLNSSHVSISYAVFCLKKKKYYEYLSLSYKKNINTYQY